MTTPTGWKKTADDLFEMVKGLEAEKARLTAELALAAGLSLRSRMKVDKLEAENEALRKVFDATWDALDGLYGADTGEKIPVTLLPEDRQQLFNRVLDVVGETGVIEMLEEQPK